MLLLLLLKLKLNTNLLGMWVTDKTFLYRILMQDTLNKLE